MDWLLSDEFVLFSQSIALIHAEKKQIKQNLKEYYEQVQIKTKELDLQAKSLSDDFEKWKNSSVDDNSRTASKK